MKNKFFKSPNSSNKKYRYTLADIGKRSVKRGCKTVKEYLYTFFKWLLIAALMGAIGGAVGAFFNRCIGYATEFRQANPIVIFGLPIAGLIIVFLYDKFKMADNSGANNVISSVRDEDEIPFAMAPLIFIGTVLTHLFGGSAGREGAALQLGGSLGSMVGRVLKLDDNDLRVVVMCGMSAVFAALFCTPLTAAFFALEVISVGIIHYSGFVPCLFSALASYRLALYFGVTPETFLIEAIPELTAVSLTQTLILAALCAAVSIIFCIVMHGAHGALDRFIPNAYIRAFVGGTIVVALTYLCGSRDYNGAGMDVITRAIEHGDAVWYAFILKIIFTAVTIGSGFKGGEIVPTFFIGATFGCAVGGLLGMNPSFAAAIGLIALFCGVVNCPIASIMLGIEMFGSEGLLLFAVAVAVSYMLSGNFGLYKSQKIIYSKLKTKYINIHSK